MPFMIFQQRLQALSAPRSFEKHARLWVCRQTLSALLGSYNSLWWLQPRPLRWVQIWLKLLEPVLQDIGSSSSDVNAANKDARGLATSGPLHQHSDFLQICRTLAGSHPRYMPRSELAWLLAVA